MQNNRRTTNDNDTAGTDPQEGPDPRTDAEIVAGHMRDPEATGDAEEMRRRGLWDDLGLTQKARSNGGTAVEEAEQLLVDAARAYAASPHGDPPEFARIEAREDDWTIGGTALGDAQGPAPKPPAASTDEELRDPDPEGEAQAAFDAAAPTEPDPLDEFLADSPVGILRDHLRHDGVQPNAASMYLDQLRAIVRAL